MRPLPDNRFTPYPTLTGLLNAADPPVSTLLRSLYKEYADRMGETEALETWHKLRADQLRQRNAQADTQALTDKLRQLDNTDALLAAWDVSRDAATSAKPYDKPSGKDPMRHLLEPMGVLFAMILFFGLGALFGLFWSYFQSH